jgi:hypothetical protein
MPSEQLATCIARCWRVTGLWTVELVRCVAWRCRKHPRPHWRRALTHKATYQQHKNRSNPPSRKTLLNNGVSHSAQDHRSCGPKHFDATVHHCKLANRARRQLDTNQGLSSHNCCEPANTADTLCLSQLLKSRTGHLRHKRFRHSAVQCLLARQCSPPSPHPSTQPCCPNTDTSRSNRSTTTTQTPPPV